MEDFLPTQHVEYFRKVVHTNEDVMVILMLHFIGQSHWVTLEGELVGLEEAEIRNEELSENVFLVLRFSIA